MTSATAYEIPVAADDQVKQMRALLDHTRAQFNEQAAPPCEQLAELFGLSAFELDIVPRFTMTTGWRFRRFAPR